MPDRKPFAATKVTAERTKTQLKQLVTKWGCRGYTSGESERTLQALIQFDAALDHEKKQWVTIRMYLPLPSLVDFDGYDTAGAARGRIQRTPQQQLDAYEKELNRRWRCLHDLVNARLIAIDTAIQTTEDAFYGDIVNPSTGRTWKESTRPAHRQFALGQPEWMRSMRELPPGGDVTIEEAK